MQSHSLHQDNREAWDLTAAIYKRDEQDNIAFLRAGGNALMQPEQDALADLSAWCKRALHLQCAGGLETLSLLRQGAAEVTGLDISPRMIASARRKTAALNAPASWYCCDVLDAPGELDGSADLVHTGRGALLWMMDLDAWAKVVFRLLRPGGRLHIFEGHPLDYVWDVDAADYRFHPVHPDYFNAQDSAGEIWPRPYIQRQTEADPASVRLHDRQWTLGQLINTVIRAGLRIEAFNEHPLTFWDQFPQIPAGLLARLPHTYTLLARKD